MALNLARVLVEAVAFAALLIHKHLRTILDWTETCSRKPFPVTMEMKCLRITPEGKMNFTKINKNQNPQKIENSGKFSERDEVYTLKGVSIDRRIPYEDSDCCLKTCIVSYYHFPCSCDRDGFRNITVLAQIPVAFQLLHG
jgi:hypothetical protein